MALPDDEKRRLAEIERRLSEDDPELAQRLATLRRAGSVRTALAVLGLTAAFLGGLVVAAVGAEQSAPVVAVAGVLFAVALPTLIIWRRWLRKLPPS